MMKQGQPFAPKLALFVVDVQPSFPVPDDIVASIRDRYTPWPRWSGMMKQ